MRSGSGAGARWTPANVLVDGERLTGLLDPEFARPADPLFDVAWWAWLVHFHTPDPFERAWPHFLEGAGVDAAAEGFPERIFALQAARVLEVVDHAAQYGEANQRMWAARLHQTLDWEPA